MKFVPDKAKATAAYLGKHAIQAKQTLANLTLLAWVVQLAGLGCVIYGVSLYSHAIAFIFGGVVAIAAIEMQGKKPPPELSEAEIREIQKRIQTALANNVDPFSEDGVPFNPLWVAYVNQLQKARKPVV